MTEWTVPMPPINWAALRALKRLTGTAVAESAYAADMDAGFDAGEWSGPEHDQMLDETIEGLVRLVAARYGIEPWVLRAWWDYRDYVGEAHRFELRNAS